MAIHISSLADMPAAVQAHRVGALVSIIQAEFQPPTPPTLTAAQHHRCAIHDITVAQPGEQLAGPEHVEALVAFLQQWDDAEPLLAHCFAGVSRSTAVALIAHAMRSGDAEASAAALRRAVPYALPNRHIVALADAELGFRGALAEALDALPERTVTKPRGHIATLPLA